MARKNWFLENDLGFFDHTNDEGPIPTKIIHIKIHRSPYGGGVIHPGEDVDIIFDDGLPDVGTVGGDDGPLPWDPLGGTGPVKSGGSVNIGIGSGQFSTGGQLTGGLYDLEDLRDWFRRQADKFSNVVRSLASTVDWFIKLQKQVLTATGHNRQLDVQVTLLLERVLETLVFRHRVVLNDITIAITVGGAVANVLKVGVSTTFERLVELFTGQESLSNWDLAKIMNLLRKLFGEIPPDTIKNWSDEQKLEWGEFLDELGILIIQAAIDYIQSHIDGSNSEEGHGWILLLTLAWGKLLDDWYLTRERYDPYQQLDPPPAPPGYFPPKGLPPRKEGRPRGG